MEELNELLKIQDRLLGPGGCPWDREQTLLTLQPFLLEEMHELIEAIDTGEGNKIAEEIGDVIHALVFVAKLGEREGTFSLKEALREVNEKLIRRHPHVFGKIQVDSTDEIMKNWDAIKGQEGKGRQSIVDGIPPTLPTLPRAQKVLHKLKRAKSALALAGRKDQTEEEIGRRLLEVIADAEGSKVDAESALRRACSRLEETVKKTPETNHGKG